jgi:hypothetical protein
VAFSDTPSVHSRRPNLPADLQRIVSRCLQKRPEDRYPNARALAEDLRRLRRDTEAGQARSVSWPGRAREWARRFTGLQPTQYAWLAGGIVATTIVVYLLATNVSAGTLVFLAVLALFLYRRVRHQPQRVLEAFVRKVARIPEVRAVVTQDDRITVVVDRAVNQLYGRIHEELDKRNRELFFSKGMSVTLRHDLAEDELRQLLNGPGVRYVRDQAESDSGQ